MSLCTSFSHMASVCGTNREYKEHTVLHYENTPMQNTVIFHICKNDNFLMKNCDIFLIFAQNIDCGYTLEPPQ